MDERISITEIVRVYNQYVALAEAMGFAVRKSVIRRKALENLQYKVDMKPFFSPVYAEQHPQRSAPAEVFENMKKLRDDLASIIRRRLNGQMPADVEPTPENIIQAAARVDPKKSADISADIFASMHGEMLKSMEVSIEDFHKAIDEYTGNQTIARSKLVVHIKEEMRKAGVKISTASIEERLRKNTKVRTVNPTMIQIVKNLDGSFKSGLAPFENITGGVDPAVWLENVRVKLGFRSKNALHKAISNETGINYETIHKALTNPKPDQRIRVEIRDYIYHWLKKVEQGEYPPAATHQKRSASPVKSPHADQAREVLKKLAATYPNRRAMLSDAASVTGLALSSLRSLCSGRGGACLDEKALAALEEMLQHRKNRPASASYLRDRQVRRRANRIAEKVERAKEAWMADRENLRLRDRFRKLRLELIITIREGYIPEEWDLRTEEFIEEHEYAEAL